MCDPDELDRTARNLRTMAHNAMDAARHYETGAYHRLVEDLEAIQLDVRYVLDAIKRDMDEWHFCVDPDSLCEEV